jgi:hypothetical protein
VSTPVRGEIVVAERTERVHFFTPDGAVNLVVLGLDSIPRAGETVEFGPDRLYAVVHVRWSIQAIQGALSPSVTTARILLQPTEDPLAAR